MVQFNHRDTWILTLQKPNTVATLLSFNDVFSNLKTQLHAVITHWKWQSQHSFKPSCYNSIESYLKNATVDCSASATTVTTGMEETKSEIIQMMKIETFFTFRWILLYFRGISRLSSLRVVSNRAWRQVEVLRTFGTSQTASSFHFARLPNWLVRSEKGVC
jgi:hypothetical protein